MKPTIIAIVGDSGSGKTHLSKLLQNEFNIFQIVSYTTRPIREGEQHGVEHYFIKKSHRPLFCEVLAQTIFGGHDYYALMDQVPPQGLCTYVVDEAGARELKQRHSKRLQIVTVWVECTPDTLIARGIDMERIQRDSARERLPQSSYDFTIANNGTIEEFDLAIYETLKKIEQWQHQK